MTLKAIKPGEAGYDPNVECSPYARPLDYWDGIQEQDWHLSADSINKPQQESIGKFLEKARHARLINITIRKDGVETTFEGDWIKHLFAVMAGSQYETATVTAADFNGQTFDSAPFTSTPKWLRDAMSDGRIKIKPDDRDYAVWLINGEVIAEPGDVIAWDGMRFTVGKKEP